MTTTHQTKIDNLSQHLADIDDQRRDIRDDIQHATERLAQAQHDLAKIHADLKAGKDVEGDDLLTATRDTADLEETLSHLQQTAGTRLAMLDDEAEKLSAQLIKASLEKRKADLSEAVRKYQEAMIAALPLADEVRRAAAAAGVILPKAGTPSVLVRPGPQLCGSLVFNFGFVPSELSA
jgi:predicted  nucleic acid-binding Zn-ribbon protein